MATPPPEPEASRRRSVAALVAAVVAAVLAGLALLFVFILDDGEDAADQVVATPTPAPAVTAAPAPTPDALAAPDDLPAGWDWCVSNDRGFGIGHPSDWAMIAPKGRDNCRFFNRTAYGLGDDVDRPPVDLAVYPHDEESFDSVVADLTDPEDYRVLRREETTVNGRRALLFEVEATDASPYPEGTRAFGYIIDRDLGPFVVETRVTPEDTDYEANVEVVREAVETLRLA